MFNSEVDTASKAVLFRHGTPWTGCDWATEFGPLKLNLQCIRSRQARTVASATRGLEAEQWLAAAKWLEKVESDAIRATELRRQADHADGKGDAGEAFRLRRAADEIEAEHRPHQSAGH
ncbi:hypothetical protein [Crateriforma conspicua]|uniref:Uncharacterized protein n=1 Tax=Crateriforma conspicua TaxID=2527996 RepID=A0A5C6FQB3_9PLAN|nr:hypothetical protein [Crateriforma conspicua]TWU62768.1 hypothetical protein V7x_45040 [Crateriforma conspicua]